MDAAQLAQGVAYLVSVDDDLARINARNGPPEPWRRPEGFATLVVLILEQQVSLASAAAAYGRLTAVLGGPPTPAAFSGLTDAELRSVGFSRQKASYCRGLATAIEEGVLNLGGLGALGDEAVRTELMRLRGIGPWTADCYLLSALGRTDVWPAGDRALQIALGRVKALPATPDSAMAAQVAAAWRPWRSVAAYMLWRDYLDGQQPPGVGLDSA